MCLPRASLHRRAFTLVEMIIVIAIIVVLASLAAAFMPRVQDSTYLSNGMDQLSQWLLTAKMRAKRDGLATGVRLIPDVTNNMVTQLQYVQQPDPLSGGACVGGPGIPGAYQYPPSPSPGPYYYYTGGLLLPSPATSLTGASFMGVDFMLGGLTQPSEWLVQPNDYLVINGSGAVHLITAVPSATTLTLSGSQAVSVPTATTNYRIYRQPRPIIGESALQLPGNIAIDLNVIPGSNPVTTYSQVTLNVTSTAYDILFAPSGAVVGANAANNKIFLYVHDLTQNPVDFTRSGIVAVQTQTGFIGSYNAGLYPNQYIYANEARNSGF